MCSINKLASCLQAVDTLSSVADTHPFPAHFTQTNLILTSGSEGDQCYNLPEKSVDKDVHRYKHQKNKEKQNVYIRKQINAVKRCHALAVKVDLT